LFDILTELHPVIETLSQIRRVQIEYGALKSLAPVRADRVILRQALLNLITHTVTHTSEKHIHLAQHRGARETGLTVRFKLAPSSAAPPSVESEWQLCDQLVSIVNGRFSIRDKDGVRHITLAWPAAPQRTVLIVDDNQGLLDLYRRYLAGQNWQVMGARNGAEARQLLLDTQPTVILLDVMMPGEDGWELLVSLKSAHELTDIPVIICSVVNQPQLAAGLGAAGYLTKPLTQQTLLQALAPWS
jgi:CheY-like chemotaxis protein